MFLRVSLGEDSFTIYDDVTDFYAMEKNTYMRCPSMDTEIPTYLEESFNPMCTTKDFTKKDKYNSEIRQAVTVFAYDPHSEYEQSGPVKYHMIGKRYDDEKFCYKKVCFKHKGVHHMMMTEYPVYVCTDQGKTIETIK